MTIPGYDTWKLASPPHLDGAPDEDCQSGGHELYEPVYAVPVFARGEEIGREFYCSDCIREEVVEHYRTCGDKYLADPPPEAYLAERCGQCSSYRCKCEES